MIVGNFFMDVLAGFRLLSSLEQTIFLGCRACVH